MYQTFYNEAFNQSGMGSGQSTQRAITAATAAVQALAGGDIKAAIAGASAPYIANAIANAIPDTDLKGRVLAHAVVNAALAAASGRDAASAAAGAAVGELVGKIAVDKLAGKIAVDGFGKPVSELSEEDKQTVSALATLASGLAGGLVGDSSANAVAAAQAGKTTVENNTLSPGHDEEKIEKEHGNFPLKVYPINPLKMGVVDDDGIVQGAGGKVIIINESKYPESAKHIEDAQAAGQPAILTIDRGGAAQRRRESLKDTPPVKGMDRDEYPPAMFKEGGTGASVRPITPSDNRGAGACIGAQCRNLPDGTSVTIKTDGDIKK
ncbi:VENN motif pre-toxin domain-containing protein [Enterobacter ludwigii]|nr:VENN motif pre-toxin domain-containing protein [Enterobacter ludwigii]